MTRLIPGRDRLLSCSPQLLDLSEALAVALRARSDRAQADPSGATSSPGDCAPSSVGAVPPPADSPPSSVDPARSPGDPPGGSWSEPSGRPARPLPDEPAAALWAAYRATPDRHTRDRLVVHYC